MVDQNELAGCMSDEEEEEEKIREAGKGDDRNAFNESGANSDDDEPVKTKANKK